MNRNMKIIFFLSLGLNILVLGMFIGRASYGTWPMRYFSKDPAERAKSFEGALAKLPEDKRTLVKEHMEKAREMGDKNRDAMDAAKDKMAKVIETDPFDEQAFRAAMAEMGAVRDAMRAQMTDSIIDLSRKLTAGERKAVWDAMRRMPPPPPPGAGPDGHRPPPPPHCGPDGHRPPPPPPPPGEGPDGHRPPPPPPPGDVPPPPPGEDAPPPPPEF